MDRFRHSRLDLSEVHERTLNRSTRSSAERRRQSDPPTWSADRAGPHRRRRQQRNVPSEPSTTSVLHPVHATIEHGSSRDRVSRSAIRWPNRRGGARPSSVDQHACVPCASRVLAEHVGIPPRMERQEGRPEAGTEHGRGLVHPVLGDPRRLIVATEEARGHSSPWRCHSRETGVERQRHRVSGRRCAPRRALAFRLRHRPHAGDS